MRGAAHVVVLMLATTTAALGWNPVEYRQEPPIRWDVTSPVVWNPDSGSFGLLDNLAITSLIKT